MADNIPVNLYNLLKKCMNGKIQDFTIQFAKNKDGEGYTGDVLFFTLTNKTSQEKQCVVIKQQSNVDGKPLDLVSGAYDNELHFYDTIWPKLQTFYTAETGKKFQYIAKCLGTNKEGAKALVLEDLGADGFLINPKEKPLEDQHFEMLFKVYGIFHGISMAFKEKNPDEYFNLVREIQFGWNNFFLQMPWPNQCLKYVVKNAQSIFHHETEKNILEKLKRYDSPSELLCELMYAESPHCVIKHGDCWNFNLMFKYNKNGQLKDLRLLDFQYIGSGTPVHDLSYCYYSGANSFENLQRYLRVYHASLSETLKDFGLDAEQIYAFETLKEEWKKHGKFGLFFSLMVFEQRFADPKTLPSFGLDNAFVPWKKLDERKDEYKKSIRDLIVHLYDNDFL